MEEVCLASKKKEVMETTCFLQLIQSSNFVIVGVKYVLYGSRHSTGSCDTISSRYRSTEGHQPNAKHAQLFGNDTVL